MQPLPVAIVQSHMISLNKYIIYLPPFHYHKTEHQVERYVATVLLLSYSCAVNCKIKMCGFVLFFKVCTVLSSKKESKNWFSADFFFVFVLVDIHYFRDKNKHSLKKDQVLTIIMARLFFLDENS